VDLFNQGMSIEIVMWGTSSEQKSLLYPFRSGKTIVVANRPAIREKLLRKNTCGVQRVN
jgi:hypothetical protein